MGRRFLDLLNWVLELPRLPVGELDITKAPEVRESEKPPVEVPYALSRIETDTRELRKEFGFE